MENKNFIPNSLSECQNSESMNETKTGTKLNNLNFNLLENELNSKSKINDKEKLLNEYLKEKDFSNTKLYEENVEYTEKILSNQIVETKLDSNNKYYFYKKLNKNMFLKSSVKNNDSKSIIQNKVENLIKYQTNKIKNVADFEKNTKNSEFVYMKNQKEKQIFSNKYIISRNLKVNDKINTTNKLIEGKSDVKEVNSLKHIVSSEMENTNLTFDSSLNSTFSIIKFNQKELEKKYNLVRLNNPNLYRKHYSLIIDDNIESSQVKTNSRNHTQKKIHLLESEKRQKNVKKLSTRLNVSNDSSYSSVEKEIKSNKINNSALIEFQSYLKSHKDQTKEYFSELYKRKILKGKVTKILQKEKCLCPKFKRDLDNMNMLLVDYLKRDKLDIGGEETEVNKENFYKLQSKKVSLEHFEKYYMDVGALEREKTKRKILLKENLNEEDFNLVRKHPNYFGRLYIDDWSSDSLLNKIEKEDRYVNGVSRRESNLYVPIFPSLKEFAFKMLLNQKNENKHESLNLKSLVNQLGSQNNNKNSKRKLVETESEKERKILEKNKKIVDKILINSLSFHQLRQSSIKDKKLSNLRQRNGLSIIKSKDQVKVNEYEGINKLKNQSTNSLRVKKILSYNDQIQLNKTLKDDSSLAVFNYKIDLNTISSKDLSKMTNLIELNSNPHLLNELKNNLINSNSKL
jgi:hypothetical protein